MLKSLKFLFLSSLPFSSRVSKASSKVSYILKGPQKYDKISKTLFDTKSLEMSFFGLSQKEKN